MTAAPKLTLHQALNEFSAECKAVLCADGWAENYANNPHLGEAELAYAALRWLEGKGALGWHKKGEEWTVYAGEKKWAEAYYWPNDPLRFYLEEVREQLHSEA